MSDKTYKFVGDGTGIPGLPHTVTKSEAHALGQSKTLHYAIQNGSYIAIIPHVEPKETAETPPTHKEQE